MTIDRMGSLDPLQNLGKTEKTSKPVRTDRSDSIELSSEAKSQAELLAVREVVRSTPEVRADRVAEIKVKLQDPNYINSAILESTAEGILKSFGL
jgi:negative regulator of flagellin synthesis FlgM